MGKELLKTKSREVASPKEKMLLPLFTAAQRCFVRIHPLWLQIQRQFRKQHISYDVSRRDAYYLFGIEETLLGFISMLIQMAQMRHCVLAEGQWKQLAKLLVRYMKEHDYVIEKNSQQFLVKVPITTMDLEQFIIQQFPQIIRILGSNARVHQPVSFLAGLQLPDIKGATQQVISAKTRSKVYNRYLNLFQNLQVFPCLDQQPRPGEVQALRMLLHIANYDAERFEILFRMVCDINKKRQYPESYFITFLKFLKEQQLPEHSAVFAYSTKECEQLFIQIFNKYLLKYASASWLFLALGVKEKALSPRMVERCFKCIRERCLFDPLYKIEEISLSQLMKVKFCGVEADLQPFDLMPTVIGGRYEFSGKIFDLLRPKLNHETLSMSSDAFDKLLRIPRARASEAQYAYSSVILCRASKKITQEPLSKSTSVVQLSSPSSS